MGTDTYTVQTSFNFATATPAVTLANYDQIWLFGINPGGTLSNPEIAAIADFMNSGGGVFATGDHASLGRGLSGSLPRIRHMREWNNIPMGSESPEIAVNRIDTVVDPGANGLYEFADQSDSIAQRIYPNYKVVSASGAERWNATVHPLLMLPGATVTRTGAVGASGFTQDIDVLPDHPHESVCYAVTNAAVLGGTYTLAGQNFEEFRPSVASGQRVGSEIVAYAVSGGRSVLNSVWKPPVHPQMFGVISAYDGRLAQPYPGKTQRPGRIVCDSTWHHFVNINLDGTGEAPRNGLGTWSGGTPGSGTFTPSPALNKIYAYYRNIVSWLQPANRIWCRLWWDLVAIRFHPRIAEELLETPKLRNWRDFVGLGRDAVQLLNLARGSQELRELITGALLANSSTEKLGDLLNGTELLQTSVNADDLLYGVLGSMLARMTTLLPDNDPEKLTQVLKAGAGQFAKELTVEAVQVIRVGFEENIKTSERTLSLLKERSALLKI
ncbi:MAG: hypothetical protein ACR9NN_04370 [Nostochopsis sp.]